MGPGTDLGSFGFFAGIWVTMIAAMMLPSAIPAITRAGRGRFVFAASYVAVWATVGTCAYLVYEAVRGMHPGFLDWDAGGRYLAAAAVVAAGLYQLTPLKRSCLRRCRAQRPAERPLASAARYGTYCVGSSAGLMVVLLVLGVMNLVWMVVVSVALALEKLAPGGERLVPAVALTLVALGAWIALDAASVPGLTLPM